MNFFLQREFYDFWICKMGKIEMKKLTMVLLVLWTEWCPSLPNSYVKNYQLQYLRLWIALKLGSFRSTKQNEAPRVDPNPIWLVSFIRKGKLTQRDMKHTTYTEERSCEDTEAAICIPRRRPVKKANLQTPWSWNSQPPELWEKWILLFKPINVWYFLTAEN